jgi:prepilin-type N-terminal cleavage/methylation domain-containing protein
VTSPERRAEGGFTLLEVMCAFAILAMVTGVLVVQYFSAVDQGTRAFHLRELREAADTVFRKIIYEEQNFNDGDSKTLDVSYAEWAQLKGAARDRWRVYRWELEKKRRTAAGQPDASKDEEAIFGARSPTDGRTETTSGSRRTEGTAAEAEAAGQALWRLTLRFFNTEDGGDEPLLVLRTYVPVRDTPAGGARAPTGGSR